jgi:glycosyltransferase involved in cell wall biosynthesis
MEGRNPADETLVDKQLRSMEQRLAHVELKTDFIANAVRSGIYQSLRRKLRPQLWTYEQYSSRRLRFPPQYRLEKAPDDPPRIALVTPSLNHGDFIRATVDSVLQQKYPQLAYIVQDGASTDDTIKVLESYGDKLRWRSEPDAGQANAINRGFREVAGDIMGYLNSDDTLAPGTLAYVARAFRNDPKLDVVYGHRIYIDIDGLEVGRCILPLHDQDTLKWADYIPQETLFWRRRVWEAVGPIDESFNFALDWDFLLRAQAAGFCFKRLPRFLACFRVHDRQKTTAMTRLGIDEMRRLRVQYLGELPGKYEIRRAIARYMLWQMLFNWMYKLGLARY